MCYTSKLIIGLLYVVEARTEEQQGTLHLMRKVHASMYVHVDRSLAREQESMKVFVYNGQSIVA